LEQKKAEKPMPRKHRKPSNSSKLRTGLGLLMGGSSERLGNAGVQELLHARIRIAFDLIGSADGDYAAFIEHRDALGNPKRQVAIMRYHKGRGMKGRHPLRGCDESDLFEFEALHQPSPQLARFCFFS
jgi:hypothetical protein